MAEETPKKERIAKRMARAGLCSRRDAERWIEEGRVVLNGEKLTTPAVTVGDGDLIVVDGKPLPKKERSRLWRYHKPVGLVTSHNDEKGRETVFDTLSEDLPRVISVGRLDINSEGLLLLTNDGELARRLELPATGWKRKYRVRVNGHPKEHELKKLEKGITIEGVRYDSIEALLDSSKGANSWLTVSIREGKNREVRKVLEHLGYPVLRLIRVSYGPLQLGELVEGEVDEVKSKILRDQMGVEKFEEVETETTLTLASRKPSMQGRDEPQRGNRGRTHAAVATEPKPAARGKSDRNEKPDRNSKPERGAKPDRNVKPDRNAKPDRSKKSDWSVKVERNTKPDRDEKTDRPTIGRGKPGTDRKEPARQSDDRKAPDRKGTDRKTPDHKGADRPDSKYRPAKAKPPVRRKSKPRIR